MAPARWHASHPPPSQPAQWRVLGSSSSMVAPLASHASGTRIACVTSGPRGSAAAPSVTLPRTWLKMLQFYRDERAASMRGTSSELQRHLVLVLRPLQLQ